MSINKLELAQKLAARRQRLLAINQPWLDEAIADLEKWLRDLGVTF